MAAPPNTKIYPGMFLTNQLRKDCQSFYAPLKDFSKLSSLGTDIWILSTCPRDDFHEQKGDGSMDK